LFYTKRFKENRLPETRSQKGEVIAMVARIFTTNGSAYLGNEELIREKHHHKHLLIAERLPKNMKRQNKAWAFIIYQII
jgi:hypothetical protein